MKQGVRRFVLMLFAVYCISLAQSSASGGTGVDCSSCFSKDGRQTRIDRARGAPAIHAPVLAIALTVVFAVHALPGDAQTSVAEVPVESPAPLVSPNDQSAPPVIVTFQDALQRAQQNDAQLSFAETEAKVAREDRNIAKAALLPSISYSAQYLGTQGNGVTPNGRYVTNDGVHVYRSWGVLHQEVSANTVLATGYRRASAAEALANAKSEIAQRGLRATVAKNYYVLVISQRKFAAAQQSLDQAKRFLDITRDEESLGQIAHSDTVKAAIQYEQQAQALEEISLATENARSILAVLLFPKFYENFSVVDDLDAAPPLPAFAEVQNLAQRQNPDLRVAVEALRQTSLDVTAAKSSFFPSLVIDTDYGIEANAFALHSVVKSFPEAGKLPNLGYFVTANLTVPVWNWGALRSKLHQTQERHQQAQAELSQAQRQLLSNLYSAYNEASVARSATDRLSRAANLAAESLRLINLRYQAGTATALEVVDAQNTLIQTRNAFDDEQVRYRTALANLQTLTGSF
jgi:outer membrane protein TolC